MGGLFRALNRTKVFRNLTEQEFAWVLYDVGNSAFIMIACSLIPIWFKSLAIGTEPGKISSDQATAYYSIAIAIVTVVVALIGPVCGVLADHKDKKKIFFTTTAGLGIAGCVLNGFATSWVLKPVGSIVNLSNQLTNLSYQTFALLFLAAFVVLALFTWIVYIPIRKIAQGANEYASGNFEANPL